MEAAAGREGRRRGDEKRVSRGEAKGGRGRGRGRSRAADGKTEPSRDTVGGWVVVVVVVGGRQEVATLCSSTIKRFPSERCVPAVAVMWEPPELFQFRCSTLSFCQLTQNEIQQEKEMKSHDIGNNVRFGDSRLQMSLKCTSIFNIPAVS